MATTHKYEKKILESHLDTFGHVNNATYLELYEEARWEMITDNGYGIKDVKERMMGPVILDLNLTFKKEILCREIITIETTYKGPKNRLVGEVSQEMINKDGDVASTLTLSLGFMDLKKRKLVEPPQEWLKALGS